MDILRDTKIDFMKYRKFWIAVSLVLLAIGIFAVFVHGRLNVGIDFAGGTQLTLKFDESPDVDELRGLLTGQGIGDGQIQRFGDPGDNEVLIKTPLAEGHEEGSAGIVVAALDRRYNGEGIGFDLNRKGSLELASLLFEADPEGIRAADADTARAHYGEVADAVLDVRRERGMFASHDELAGAPGVTPEVVSVLRERTGLGRFAVLGVENVGPQVGEELRRKGLMAVLLSMVGMLIYIWLRFELRFGVGALMAVVHDVLVTLGLFALFGFEFNLTTVAAFLTLIGYSVNDTVVVFDRVRENLRKSRRLPFIDTLNLSLNQTLSRTILTGGSTLLATLMLFIFGGDVIRGFAFVLMLGVLIGTYSSLYIAGPFALLWDELTQRREAKAGGPRPTPAKGGDSSRQRTATR